MNMTGVKATEEEVAELRKLAEAATNTPLITFGLGAPSWAAQARERLYKRGHEIALAHGLPEIKGYYGITWDGEFIEPEDHIELAHMEPCPYPGYPATFHFVCNGCRRACCYCLGEADGVYAFCADCKKDATEEE